MTDKPAKGESPESGDDVEKPGSPEVKDLRDLYDLMLAEGLDSLEVKDEDIRIQLTRRFAGPNAIRHVKEVQPAQEPQTPPPANSNLEAITTPLAGVFYRASSPTSAPFVKEGDVADSGQTLCIVEAMKVMNEIKADKRCRIARITAENSQPVTAGQPLFMVEPA